MLSKPFTRTLQNNDHSREFSENLLTVLSVSSQRAFLLHLLCVFEGTNGLELSRYIGFSRATVSESDAAGAAVVTVLATDFDDPATNSNGAVNLSVIGESDGVFLYEYLTHSLHVVLKPFGTNCSWLYGFMLKL